MIQRISVTSSLALSLAFSVGVGGCGDDTNQAAGGGGAGSGGATTAATTSAITSSTSSTAGGSDGQGGAGGTGTGGGAGAGDAGGGDAGGAGGGGDPAWAAPDCSEVSGEHAAATFTLDEGDTLAARDASLGGVRYTWGLVALDTPNTLLASHDGALLRSTDAGCSWSEVAPLPGTLLQLVAAPGGRAYGFEVNAPVFFRVDGDTVTDLTIPFEASVVRGLGVDPLDGDHIRVAEESGAVWDSTDGGVSFERVGGPAAQGCSYVVEFDPRDLDHAVCGTATYGAWVTFDGGALWQEATGDALYSQAFTAAISPADPDVVWVVGHENGMFNGEVIGEDLRHLWRSTDGGLTYTSILDERSEATGDGTRVDLVNGNPLHAHPTDPAVAYYTFGSPPGVGGPNIAELFRVDGDTGEVSVEIQSGGDIDDYGALAFHPADPSIIYLGLTSERLGGP